MAFIFPIAHAAVDATLFGNTIDPIISKIVYPAIELLFIVAFFVFAWGIAKMIIRGDDSDAREKGKWSILWGSVGMFLMLSAWGIIYIISNTIKGI